MTTLELQLDDELEAFVQKQSQSRGHASAAAYVESLLAVERLRDRSIDINELLRESSQGKTQLLDDAYWKRLEAEIFVNRSAEQTS